MTTQHIIDVKKEKANAIANGIDIHSRISLFQHLVNSGLPESELSVDRLSREAQVLFGAGTVSTARTLDFASYYILANKHIHARLKEELQETMDKFPEKVPSTAQLEKIPYLQAIVKEALR